MPASIPLTEETLIGFALVLTRLAGFFVFVPLPFARFSPDLARVSLVLSWSVAMFPFWPRPQGPVTLGMLTMWSASEILFGAAIGVAIALLSEGLTLGAQLIASQAGYSYASSIDPNSMADSGVLPVFIQLMTALLFFAFGFDGRVFAALAASLTSLPPGSWSLGDLGSPDAWIRLSSGIFATGLKLALPVIGLLLLLDLTLALISRLNQQLQLLTVAFPMKMLMSLTALSLIAPALAAIYRDEGEKILSAIESIGRAAGR